MDDIDRPDWRQRFRAPTYWSATIGAAGRGLVVGSVDGSSIQLCRWDVSSGRLTPVTDDRLGVGHGWLDPSGSWVFYVHDEDGSEVGHLVRVPYAGGEPEDVTPALTPYTLRGLGFSASGDRLAFNPVNADGFALYTVDLGPTMSEPHLVHRDTWETWGAQLSARGDLAACWSTARAKGLRLHTLMVFDVARGELVGELDDGRESAVRGVCFSPVDGDDRILASTTRSGFARPVIWHPRTGERLDPALSDLDGEVMPVDWSPDGTGILLCRTAGAQHLFRYDLHSGQLTELDHPPGAYLDAFGDGTRFAPDGHIVALRERAETPPEVVELDGRTGRPRRVLLPSAPAPAGRPWRSVTFPSADGTTIQAWLATPEGDGPFPTILETHGGPHYAVTEHYDPAAQCWVDSGYAWLSVNFRGSTGFGRVFAEQIWGDLGRLELDDMVAAREWLVAEGIAEPTEVFPMGASYGGYLTLFALGRRPDLWAGGLAVAADADFALSYEDATESTRAAVAAWMRGTPQERPEAYARSSALTYVSGVTAPVLAIHMRNDTRCPPRQLEEYERRMRALGKEIEVVWVDGGHQSVGPDVFVHFYELMIDFADRVLARQRATNRAAPDPAASG